MKVFKELLKYIGAHAWEIVKSSFLALLFYGIASAICFMGMLNEEWTGAISEGLNATRITWVVLGALLAAAYNGMVAYANGGKGYEMLVSGNMKRLSAERLGSAVKISTHKEVQEYRDWKGFASGAVIALFTFIFACVMEGNSAKINDALLRLTQESSENMPAVETGTAIILLVCLLLSGWSLLPFVFANIVGAGVSYMFSALFGLIPIAVTGGLYIAGAYARRAKTYKAQLEADAAAKKEAEKPRKINYGGLPGTKPKKKKK